MSEVSHSQSESSLKPKNPKMASKFSAILRIVHMRHLEMRLFFLKHLKKTPTLLSTAVRGFCWWKDVFHYSFVREVNH